METRDGGRGVGDDRGTLSNKYICLCLHVSFLNILYSEIVLSVSSRPKSVLLVFWLTLNFPGKKKKKSVMSFLFVCFLLQKAIYLFVHLHILLDFFPINLCMYVYVFFGRVGACSVEIFFA